jgi:hypothetical protein
MAKECTRGYLSLGLMAVLGMAFFHWRHRETGNRIETRENPSQMSEAIVKE